MHTSQHSRDYKAQPQSACCTVAILSVPSRDTQKKDISCRYMGKGHDCSEYEVGTRSTMALETSASTVICILVYLTPNPSPWALYAWHAKFEIADSNRAVAKKKVEVSYLNHLFISAWKRTDRKCNKFGLIQQISLSLRKRCKLYEALTNKEKIVKIWK